MIMVRHLPWKVRMKSYHVMKSKEVKIVKEVIPCDASPVAKFSFERLRNMSSFHGLCLKWGGMQMQPKLWPSLKVRYNRLGQSSPCNILCRKLMHISALQ